MTATDLRALIVQRDLTRWCLAAAAALALHGLAVHAALRGADPSDDEGGLPAVMVELAPITAAFASPMDLAHGPDRIEVPSEDSARAPPQPEQKKDETQRPPETPVPDPAVTLPQERRLFVDEAPPPDHAEETPVPTAPPVADAPSAAPAAAPAAGRAEHTVSAATAKWHALVAAHLQRHKRYPARARGAEGTAKLAFRIDGNGQLLASRLVSSSGSAALDDETIALVTRAQPFPPPPPGVSPDELSLIVPVRYARARGP